MILSPVVTAKSVAGTLYTPTAYDFALSGRSAEAGPLRAEKTRRQLVDNRERAPDAGSAERTRRSPDQPLPEPSTFIAQRISQERPAENPAGLRSGAVAAYGAQARQARFVSGLAYGIDLIA